MFISVSEFVGLKSTTKFLVTYYTKNVWRELSLQSLHQYQLIGLLNFEATIQTVLFFVSTSETDKDVP